MRLFECHAVAEDQRAVSGGDDNRLGCRVEGIGQ
jgi:hypothetical protein